MARCEDCLHYDLCEALERGNGIPMVHPVQCGCFKNKADVVEIVRCKACKWWHTEGCAFRKDALPSLPEANDFCSHGEKLEGGAGQV